MSEGQAVTYTAVFEQVEDGWVQAQLAELPEVITVAPTRLEATEYLVDALQEYLRSLQQPAQSPMADSVDRESIEVAINLKSA